MRTTTCAKQLSQTIPLPRRSMIRSAMASDAAASGYLSIGKTGRRKSTQAILERRMGSSFSRSVDRFQGELEMSRRVLSLCLTAASMLAANAFCQSFLSQYKGMPYSDTRYQGGPQKVPGRVLCAYYDLGGEGVAYHDTDSQNHGSGELNPADGTYLNEFRIHEGVDISYTKFERKTPIDDNPFNKVVPPRDLFYVGWTQPGEWFN